MKTWKKRMLSFSATVLALLLVSEINEKDYAGILMERGYSEELVKRMSEKDIAYQAVNDFQYENTWTQIVSAHEEGMETFGSIKNEDLRISISYTVFRNPDHTLKEMYVNCEYEWKTPTSFGYEDAWGISWDHKELYYKDDSYIGRTYRYDVGGSLDTWQKYNSLSSIGAGFIGGYVNQDITHKNTHNQTFYLEGDHVESDEVIIFASYGHGTLFPKGVGIASPAYRGGAAYFTGSYEDQTRGFRLDW